MKLVDSNVWLALLIPPHVFHRAAQDFVNEPIADGELVFCRSTQQSLLRLLTTAAVWKPYGNQPLTNAEAWSLL